MGLIDRLFGRRRRESVDAWARRDDSSQYVYTPISESGPADRGRDDARDDTEATGDDSETGDSGGGDGGGGGNGGGGGGNGGGGGD
jgi:hypothetical protein